MIIKNKKSQAEIIVTVLIILLVLAAIVIVWQVVQNTIAKGAGEIPGQTDCLITRVNIIAAKSANTSSLTLKREVGKGSLAGIVVVVDGNRLPDIIDLTSDLNKLNELEQKTYDVKLTGQAGKYVKIAKLIGNNIQSATLCDFTDNSVGEGFYIASA